MITMPMAILGEKLATSFDIENVKNPARTTERQQSPIKNEEKKGIILNLVGGAE